MSSDVHIIRCLSKVIQEVIGKDVMLIDSGVASAEVVRDELDRIGLHTNKYSPGNHEFYVSDIPVKFKEIAELFLGNPVDNIHKVDIEHITAEPIK